MWESPHVQASAERVGLMHAPQGDGRNGALRVAACMAVCKVCNEFFLHHDTPYQALCLTPAQWLQSWEMQDHRHRRRGCTLSAAEPHLCGLHDGHADLMPTGVIVQGLFHATTRY